MATQFQVVFDCADPDRLATFWAIALGYKKQDPPEGFASWEAALEAQGIPKDQWDSASAVVDPTGLGPRIYFQRVPEGKSTKNRLHLDLNVGGGRKTPLEERRKRIDAEAERLVAAGARRGRAFEERGGFHVQMRDPEDNEFDLQ
jgi:hypothetical protein